MVISTSSSFVATAFKASPAFKINLLQISFKAPPNGKGALLNKNDFLSFLLTSVQNTSTTASTSVSATLVA